jgi:hypothetical protein
VHAEMTRAADIPALAAYTAHRERSLAAARACLAALGS